MIKRLYKYRSLEKDSWRFTVDLLIDNSFYFAPWDRFNDPLEFEFVFTRHNESQKMKEDLILLNHLNPNSNSKQSIRKKIENANHNQLKELQWELEYTMKRSWGTDIGTFCFSSSPDNLLMWGHYSNGQRGICIEFCDQTDGEFYRDRLRQVKYSSKKPILDIEKLRDPESDQVMEMMMDIMSTKSPDWEYEKEWRLYSKDSGVYSISSTFVSRVIFGSEISKKDRNDLINLLKLKNPNAQLIQAVQEEEKYGLKFVDMSTGEQLAFEE